MRRSFQVVNVRAKALCGDVAASRAGEDLLYDCLRFLVDLLDGRRRVDLETFSLG